MREIERECCCVREEEFKGVSFGRRENVKREKEKEKENERKRIRVGKPREKRKLYLEGFKMMTRGHVRCARLKHDLNAASIMLFR